MIQAPEMPLKQKLMNMDEAIPDEFFIFVKDMNPMTFHNLTITKTFASAGITTASLSAESLKAYIEGTLDFIPYSPKPPREVALSPYCVSAISDYSIEYDADYYRFAINRLYPSRLSAIYAFGDFASCEAVHRKYGWPLEQVKRFKIVPNPLTRVVKVNMEIISVLRYAAYRVSMVQDVAAIWQHYWSGYGDFSMELPDTGFRRSRCDSGIIWEYLIDGQVRLIE